VKFGVLFDFANPVPWRRSGTDVYREVIEHTKEIEELGFDSVWLTEHHFSPNWDAPSTLPLAAVLASHTSRLRIGTWALLLPLHNPLRVAEDVLVIDQIANGRFELGCAAGYRVEEFNGFGINRDDRPTLMEEGLTVLKHALKGQPVSVSGRFFNFDDVLVTPPPTNEEVKIWSGGQVKGSVRRAARHRCHFIPSGAFVRPLYDAYARQLLDQGDDPADFGMVGFQPWFVTERPEESKERLKPHLDYRFRCRLEWYEKANDPGGGRAFAEQLQVANERDELGGVIGDPDEITSSILEFVQRAPYTEVISWASPLGLDSETAMQSLRLFARKVMPELRGLDRQGDLAPASGS
jgi:alkanesulfonate monooxygenase SsuD/methylene tetrahydromethanopterin reductase-like flavin-dependent oxidoreductase (luciferase family)